MRRMHSRSDRRGTVPALPIFLLAAASAGGAPALAQERPVPAGGRVVEVPATFVADRVWVRPVTASGDTLAFYTDTGGGANMLYEPALARIGAATREVAMGDDRAVLALWPEWSEGAWIPEPGDTTRFSGRDLLVMPFEGQAAMLHEPGDAGFLGAGWFGDRAWTFDYPAGRLLLHPDGVTPRPGARALPLGFQVGDDGRRTSHFPRMPIVVDGDTLHVLLDTGATMLLTEDAVAALGGGPPRRASSFISAAVFDRWREAHADWRVIEDATRPGAHLILVPEVAIAGETVGPVWFERRREGTFEQYMAQWMDAPIVGALGGTGLRFFRVTIDYPNAVAYFERVTAGTD